MNERLVSRRTAITTAATGGFALATGMLNAQDQNAPKKGNDYRGSLNVDADKVLLYWWEFEYYGALLELDLFWYRNTSKFCLEGKLSYARIVKVGEGNLCVEQGQNGDFTCTAQAEIKVAGKKVAKFDARVTQNVDWNAGQWKLKEYDIEVCGSNTFELKCKVWKEEFKNQLVYGISSDEDTDDSLFLLGTPLGSKGNNVLVSRSL